MSIRMLAAGAAALALYASLPASGADLYGPSDDPRYSDIYKHPAPPPPAYGAPPPPPMRYYSDEGYAPPPPRFAGPGIARFGSECLPLRIIRERLLWQGWRDFSEGDLLDGRALVRARRPGGGEFALRVDRCTGQVIEARFIDGRPDAYAWRPRNFYQPY